MSEEGKKALRAISSAVRAKIVPSGDIMAHARGIKTIEDVFKELSGPEGPPGLLFTRDGQTRLKLHRRTRNAEITLAWERGIGVMELSCTKHGEAEKLTRYVWEEAEPARFRRMELETEGELWADLAAALPEYLYPEVKT